MDAHRTTLVERTARLALVASLGTYGVEAVDCLGEDAGAGGLTYTSRTAEEVCMSQLVALNGILKRRGNMLLTNDRVEGRRTIFSCRYYKLFHNRDKVTK